MSRLYDIKFIHKLQYRNTTMVLFKSTNTTKICPYKTTKLGIVINFVRCVYVVVATIIVCRGFYHAYEKFRSEDVSTRQEYNSVDKLRYPSITFCYKYKHGSKRAFDNYLLRLAKKAKHEGKYQNTPAPTSN